MYFPSIQWSCRKWVKMGFCANILYCHPASMENIQMTYTFVYHLHDCITFILLVCHNILNCKKARPSSYNCTWIYIYKYSYECIQSCHTMMITKRFFASYHAACILIIKVVSPVQSRLMGMLLKTCGWFTVHHYVQLQHPVQFSSSTWRAAISCSKKSILHVTLHLIMLSRNIVYYLKWPFSTQWEVFNALGKDLNMSWNVHVYHLCLVHIFYFPSQLCLDLIFLSVIMTTSASP